MPQLITAPKLASINLGVTTAYNKQFGLAPSVYKKFCYLAKSSGSGEIYPRLDLIKGLREWIGDRVYNSLSQTTFQINNRTFEDTLAVSRNDIEDDRYGILTPSAEFLGQIAGAFPDTLVAQLMLAGHVTPCYDGQNFFDTAHPDFSAPVNGVVSATTSSNYFVATGGDANGAPWYLIDARQVLRPVIFQERRPFVITPRIALTDPVVFDQNQFVWGVDGRCNVGFGIWQTAAMCTGPLNAKYFELIRAAMTTRRRPDGTPMNIMPTLCVVPSVNLGAAKSLFEGEYLDPSLNGGIIQSNRWKGACEVLEDTFLN